MNRRNFFAALACLPLVGKLVKQRPAHEILTFTNYDGVEPRGAVMDPFCPAGQLVSVRGVMMIPVGVAKRLPRPDAVVVLGGASFEGWSLKWSGRSLARLT